MSFLLDVWASGIDFDLPGNGGPKCLAHSSLTYRIFETLLALTTFFGSVGLGLRNHTPPSDHEAEGWPKSSNLTRRILLWGLAAAYLAEIGYKAATYQLIFTANPCHVLCLVHLYLLSDFHSRSKLKLYVFRIHLFHLHGPLLAVIFPVVNTRFLPGEVAAFWVEHAFLLLVPVYLLRQYEVPPAKDLLNWLLLAYGFWGIYHYLILQPLALVSMGNLNSILCPAITDPFNGPHYRLHAVWHQLIATLVSGCFWWKLGQIVGRERNQEKETQAPGLTE